MDRKGFTLIELLVVISIISLLSSVVLASLTAAREKGRLAAGKQFAASVDHALGDQAAALWDFEECPSGTSALDRSGNNSNGTLSAGATWSADTMSGSGCSLSFDGTSGWVSGIAQPPVQTAPNVFTIAGMIRPDNQYGILITPQSNGIDQWLAYDSSNRRIELRVAEAADTNERARPTPIGSVPLDKWTHFAVTINDKDIKIYINGSLSATYSESINIGGWTGNWVIGQRGNSQYWYKGKIDNLHVYSTVLTAHDIHRLYALSASRYLANRVE